MMKQPFTTPYTIYSSCLVILFILSSCSDDMTFSLPDTDPLLAVQSFIGPDHDSRVRVTMARGIQDPAIQMDIDCQVDLFENGVFYKSLTLDTPAILSGTISTKGYLDFPVDSSVVLSEGKEYTVKVNYPGFETVTATDTKPNTVKIKELSWRSFNGEWPEWFFDTPAYRISLMGETRKGDPLIEITVVIDDPPDTENFYRMGLNHVALSSTYLDRDCRMQYAIYSDPDPPYMTYRYKSKAHRYSGSLKGYNWAPITQWTTWELLWSDKSFNGSSHSFKIIAPHPGDGTYYVVSLYSLSYDYYNYMIDRWKYYKVSDDPFSEPIRLHSNTSNGCGIFAMYSVDKDTLQF
ncbi:MAG TPA: DUF4249 domain-containing protein [Bacteroidales bacterium]|nr:DUF4249 domain-containing protein [Bacteroidales bacterium]